MQYLFVIVEVTTESVASIISIYFRSFSLMAETINEHASA